jgi:hypothetical protein
MNFEIFQGAIFGAVGGLLVAIPFLRYNKIKVKHQEKLMSNEIDKTEVIEKSIFDRWSVRLALFGVGLGVFTTLGLGYTKIGFMIGFAIPMSIFFGFIGLIIDFIKGRKNS